MKTYPWIDTTVNQQPVELTWYTQDGETALGTLVVRRQNTTTRYHPVAEEWYNVLADAGYTMQFMLSAATCSPRPPAHVTRIVGRISGRVEPAVSLTATRILAALTSHGLSFEAEDEEAVAAASVAVALTKHSRFDKREAIERVSSVSSYEVSRLSKGREKVVSRLFPNGTLQGIAEADATIEQHQIPAKIQQGTPQDVFRTTCTACNGTLTVDAVQHDHAYGQREAAVFTHSDCGDSDIYVRSDWEQASGMSE